MEKKGAFILVLFLTTFFGTVVGVFIDNITLGFFVGLGIGVAFATAVSSTKSGR